ncbi:MAG TPA: FHA domain-containing protein [Pirellulales bacterium]|jgi:pSer/pThr/pTyr-binding forkhead associated (FHA) protein
MEVRLKVLLGPNAGKELPVAGPKFLIGRAEDCQLRPRSDLISRHHCVLLIEDGMMSVRDFGSKNGTLVNGERVRGECELKNGDKLVVGPLEFEFCVHVGVASKKRPKVESIKEAAARTAEGSGGQAENDVEEWIKPDEEQASKDTRRFSMNETEEIDLKSGETQVGPFVPPQQQPVPAPHAKGKAQPGKLPPMPAKTTGDSGQAATDVLNKFFKRR